MHCNGDLHVHYKVHILRCENNLSLVRLQPWECWADILSEIFSTGKGKFSLSRFVAWKNRRVFSPIFFWIFFVSNKLGNKNKENFSFVMPNRISPKLPRAVLLTRMGRRSICRENPITLVNAESYDSSSQLQFSEKAGDLTKTG